MIESLLAPERIGFLVIIAALPGNWSDLKSPARGRPGTASKAANGGEG